MPQKGQVPLTSRGRRVPVRELSLGNHFLTILALQASFDRADDKYALIRFACPMSVQIIVRLAAAPRNFHIVNTCIRTVGDRQLECWNINALQPIINIIHHCNIQSDDMCSISIYLRQRYQDGFCLIGLPSPRSL